MSFVINFANKIRSIIPCCSLDDDDLLPSKRNTIQLDLATTSRIQECYRRNVEAIMQATGTGSFINQKGELIFTGSIPSSEEQQAGIELVQQVLRQAWGKVIEAQCAIGIPDKGPLLLEEAIHRVDLLQDKLYQILPHDQAQKILADEKWAKILPNNYRASTTDLMENFNLSPSPPETIHQIQLRLLARDRAVQDYRDIKKAEYNYVPLAKEGGGLNYSSTRFVDKGDERHAVIKKGTDVNWETSALAWLNEMIGAAFDQICGRRFGTATSATINESDQVKTIHSFKKTDDDRWHQAFDPFVEQRGAHQFVLLNILLKLQDSHKGNILCRQENGKYVPIPIDFGRMLSHSPHRSLESFLRFTAFIKWGTLNRKFDAETKEFVQNLDPDRIIKAIRELFVNHPLLTLSEMEILERKLVHLRANILMVKEALKEDLTPRQLIALSTFKMKAENLTEMKEIESNLEKPDESKRALRQYLVENCYCVFLSAWNYARRKGPFDDQRFIQKIRPDILKIKGMNVSVEYFNKEALEMFEHLYL